jgi:hypothetical protein
MQTFFRCEDGEEERADMCLKNSCKKCVTDMHHEVKHQAVITYYALVLGQKIVSHPFFRRKTKCIPICMPGSSFMRIVTYKCIQKQYLVRKRKIIRALRLILETKAPNITGSRLGVAYA